MDPDTIPNLLAELRDGTSEGLEHYYITFEDYWERKLWHELTESLLEFFANPESRNQRIPLFITFVSSFADKINQLQLVTIALNTASQFPGTASCLPLYQVASDVLPPRRRLATHLSHKTGRPRFEACIAGCVCICQSCCSKHQTTTSR